MERQQIAGKYTRQELSDLHLSKGEIFGQLESAFDYALPQNELDYICQISALPYDLIRSTCVYIYDRDFTGFVSCCDDVQSFLEDYYSQPVKCYKR